MVELELTDEERRMLREMLEGTLSDLRMEIADTERAAFREQLKIRKDVLIKVIESLGR